MKKALLLIAALTLLWTYQANVNVASAHGGAYRGPSGEVPPGQRDPKDPQPPPENPTTPPPGGGGEETPPGGPPDGPPESPPPDGGDAPPRPEPPPPNPGGGPGGVVSPGAGKKAAPPPMSFENWLFWWAYNKDEILNLKAKLKASDAEASRSSMYHLTPGGGRSKEAPTDEAIRTVIVPALEQVVQNEEIHPDIRGGALIALARTPGGQKYIPEYFEIAKYESRGEEDKVVQESAIIALGILQQKTPEVREFLLGIVNNTDYPMRGRCFAMLALGLLKDNHPDVFAALEARLDGSEAQQDIPVCALLAIGLIGDNKKVPELIDWAEKGRIGRNRLGELEISWIYSALGKIGDPEAVKAIFKALGDRGLYTKRAAAIAVGQIVPQLEVDEQKDLVKKVIAFHRNESDLTAKNFALMSMARIAGVKNADEELRRLVVEYLKYVFEEGNKTTERPFAALAMGLVAVEDSSRALKEELTETIRPVLAERRGDKIALGAQAIALGMIGHRDKKVVDTLVALLKDKGLERKLRGSAAVALGLIGDKSATEAILSALEEREDRDLRIDTAVAAGLIGASDAVETLVRLLQDPKASQFVLGSVALALGQIGDHRAVNPLVTILEPEKVNGSQPDLTRALVAVALGQLADRRDYRILYQLSKDINYRATVGSLDEILTIL